MQNSQYYLRLWQIIGCRKRGELPLIPISRSTWLAGVKSQRFPAPLKIGRCAVWRSEDIATFIKNLNSNYSSTKGISMMEAKETVNNQTRSEFK